MPSEKILTQKQAFVAELKEKLASSVAGVVVDYKGINVADDTKLRKELREAGVDYFVVKNTMLRLAIKGTELEGMADVLEGTTAIAIASEDRIAASRILCKFADASKGKFSVKTGYMDGKVMEKAEIEEIAKLPGLEGMLSMFAGALTSTLSGLAIAMQAYVDKSEEEPAA
ncbi:50S ribosomal protein L10 [gut metagenome]|uniref:50S ribosomal protein L10 n=1 Tax=gut metagenome TaxID=749906 RepID=J9G2V7_9ZZZZ